MKYLSKMGFAIALSMIFYACNKEVHSTSNELLQINTEEIQKIIEVLDQTYNYSIINKGNKGEEMDIDQFFIKNMNEKGLNITTISKGLKPNSKKLSKEFKTFEFLIADSTSFSSKDDYLSHLIILEESIRESNISFVEKELLINKIAFMNAFVSWLDAIQEQNLTKSPMSNKRECEGWWSCWGKCTASVLGGAGTGALAGALVPAASCTLIVPVIGTVACGTIGRIVGGLSGALTAAGTADAC